MKSRTPLLLDADKTWLNSSSAAGVRTKLSIPGAARALSESSLKHKQHLLVKTKSPKLLSHPPGRTDSNQNDLCNAGMRSKCLTGRLSQMRAATLQLQNTDPLQVIYHKIFILKSS